MLRKTCDNKAIVMQVSKSMMLCLCAIELCFIRDNLHRLMLLIALIRCLFLQSNTKLILSREREAKWDESKDV